jgi:4-hydroxyphenylacetate 3-monooxygenase
VARSFMLPRTREELAGISVAMRVWEDHTRGMMGRVPDYINRAVSGFAAGAAFLGEPDPRFAANAVRYHEYLREQDLCATHTLIPPQANRAVNSARQADPYLAARVKEETDSGFVVRGCRMLATLPTADELMVFPSTLLKSPEEDAPYAFGFLVPSDTPGLRFLCREGLDYGRSHFDHPLGSRFDEMDAVVVFDDVFVPWENVLLYRDIARCNQAYARTGAVVHMTHQVVVKNVAKAEFMLGLAHLLADSIGAEGFQHIQEKLAELWVTMETMKAFLRAAEADAALDEWGVMRPAWNPADRGIRTRRNARRGRSQGAAARGHQTLFPGGSRTSLRPHPAVPPRLGRLAVRLRVAPGALRALLLRRSRAHGGRGAGQPPFGNTGACGASERFHPRGAR